MKVPQDCPKFWIWHLKKDTGVLVPLTPKRSGAADRVSRANIPAERGARCAASHWRQMKKSREGGAQLCRNPELCTGDKLQSCRPWLHLWDLLWTVQLCTRCHHIPSAEAHGAQWSRSAQSQPDDMSAALRLLAPNTQPPPIQPSRDGQTLQGSFNSCCFTSGQCGTLM